MRTSDQNSPLAKTYAEALLELAVAQPDPGGAETIGLQLAAIRKIVRTKSRWRRRYWSIRPSA